jgi:ribonuclease BN (tRNA processing enzyme)
VILSHLHADHISDILSMRYAVSTALREGRMKKPPFLFMPSKPKKTFRYVHGTVKRDFFVTPIRERLELDLDGLRVSFLRTAHPIETYAVKFTAPAGSTGAGSAAYAGSPAGVSPGERERSIVYTADTSLFPGLVRFCAGARVHLTEATHQDRDGELERLGHMTASRAGELARSAGVRTLVLTHVWPEYDRSLSVAEAKLSFDGDVVLAGRGLLLSV